ncbi:MAG TPA: MerR family transcriptional regulator [Chitinophagales bacterium]
MNENEINSEKRYFSISEAATLLNVNASQLRFWETEFPDLQIRKDRGGARLYTKENLALLRTIQILLKEKGFTIDGARAQLSAYAQSSDKRQAISTLKNVKSFLEELNKWL